MQKCLSIRLGLTGLNRFRSIFFPLCLRITKGGDIDFNFHLTGKNLNIIHLQKGERFVYTDFVKSPRNLNTYNVFKMWIVWKDFAYKNINFASTHLNDIYFFRMKIQKTFNWPGLNNIMSYDILFQVDFILNIKSFAMWYFSIIKFNRHEQKTNF